MKKIFFIASVFTVLLFISCENDNIDFNTASDEKVNQVLKLKGESQRMAYKLLSSNEKFNVWKKHLNNELNKDIYSSSQKEYIKNVINLLDEEFFYENVTAQKLKKNKEIIYGLRQVGFKYFNKQELGNLIASLNGNLSLSVYQKAVPPLGSCNCNHVNDWCVWGSSCFGTPYCGYSSSGCGDLWQDPCTGICVRN
jgi:hypothetical protein